MTMVVPAAAQRPIFSAGIQHNTFTNYGNARISEYTPGWGFSLQSGLEDIPNAGIRMSVLLHLDYYQGTFHSIGGGPGSSVAYIGETRKWQLGASLYPLDLVIANRLHLQPGADLGMLLHYRDDGEYRISTPTESRRSPLGSVRKLHNTFTGAVGTRISWRIPLDNHWQLVPQYTLFWGFTPDMLLSEKTYSVRSTVSIGFLRIR